MGYAIELAILCDTGKRRHTNQDNFWYAGKFLESENNGLTPPIAESIDNTNTPILAVFDGMGGERYGEVAAYVAAKALDEATKPGIGDDLSRFLADACTSMNNAVCAYAESNKVGRMGSTAAIIAFGKKKVHVCNLGDSGIFLRDSKNLTQISQDHVVQVPNLKKFPLSQHLGVHEEEFTIEPHLATGDYNSGDRYLICTDGLTDMVPFEEIDSILTQGLNVAETADLLMEKALEYGGKDNITIILCEVKRKKLSLKNLFKKKAKT